MFDNQKYDNIFLFTIESIRSGLTIDQVLDLFFETGLEMTNDEIDPVQLRSYLDAQLQPILQIRKAKLPVSREEMESAVNNLLKNHDFKFIDETGILEDTIHNLSKYDKLIEIDNNLVPVLLNQLFDIFNLYSEMLKVRDDYDKESDSIDRTIALSSSNTPEKMLSPLNPYMKENQHNGTIRPSVYKNIVSSYIEDPYATDYALSAMRSLGMNSMKNIDAEKIQAFEFASGYINSTLRVEKKDIINSLKIVIANLYLKDSQIQKMLGLENHLAQETLASYIDHFLGYVFMIDTKKKITDHRKFKQPVQVRTHFDCVPLYEYIRKGKEKSNPALSDVAFQEEFQEKIKGKISSNMPVPNSSNNI